MDIPIYLMAEVPPLPAERVRNARRPLSTSRYIIKELLFDILKACYPAVGKYELLGAGQRYPF
jgi:hypothetical protein